MRRHIATLTGIRGLAAAWVVIFHSYPLVSSLLDLPERARIPFIRDGFLAVDLFFILSGFVVSHAYADSFRENVRGNYGAFLGGRIGRIFPLHWVCLCIMVLLVHHFPGHWWGPGPFSSHSLADSVALVEDWDARNALAWNHPAWSLSAEWFTYLLFPAAAWAIGHLRSRALAAGGAVLALTVFELYLFSIGSTTVDHIGKAGILRCLCEFMAGAFIWKTLQGDLETQSSKGDGWLAVGAVLLGLAVWVRPAQPLAPFALAVLIVGCVLPSRAGPVLLGNRALTGLGEISFSIYLIHIPILGLLALIASLPGAQDAGLLPRVALVVAIPPLVIGAAILLWRFVERPGRGLLRPVVRTEREMAPAPTGSTLAFWMVMVVAMTFSETAADFLATSVALGYLMVAALAATAAVSAVWPRLDVDRLGPLPVQGLVLCISMAGTILSDFLDKSAGLGDVVAATGLASALLAIRCARRVVVCAALRPHLVSPRAEPMFGWLTVLLAAALCTSLGDLLSQRAGLDRLEATMLISAGLACVALAATFARLSRGLAYWSAFILIRPLGVALGDALTAPHANGGLQFGAGNSSLLLAVAMVALIPIAGRQLADLIRQVGGDFPVGRPL